MGVVVEVTGHGVDEVDAVVLGLGLLGLVDGHHSGTEAHGGEDDDDGDHDEELDERKSSTIE